MQEAKQASGEAKQACSSACFVFAAQAFFACLFRRSLNKRSSLALFYRLASLGERSKKTKARRSFYRLRRFATLLRKPKACAAKTKQLLRCLA
jgi:hypothetical protein